LKRTPVAKTQERRKKTWRLSQKRKGETMGTAPEAEQRPHAFEDNVIKLTEGQRGPDEKKKKKTKEKRGEKKKKKCDVSYEAGERRIREKGNDWEGQRLRAGQANAKKGPEGR